MKELTVYLAADQNFIQNANQKDDTKPTLTNHKKFSNHIKALQKFMQTEISPEMPLESSRLLISKENLIRLISNADENLNVVLFVTNDQGKSRLDHSLIKDDCIMCDIEPNEMERLVKSFTGDTDKDNKHDGSEEDTKTPGKSKKKLPEKYKLTETEIEILTLICNEKTSEEIADTVCLGRRTIEHYRRRILIKTNCQTPIGLVKFAIKHGLYRNP